MPIHVRWLGHAAFQIKTNEIVLYIDPRYMKKLEHLVGHLFEQPEKANIILFTHHHVDHCYPSSFNKMLTPNTALIGPKICTDKIGTELKVITPGDEIKIGDIQIQAVNAYNSKRFRTAGKPWHPKGEGVGYLITIEDNVIYYAGDTDLIPEMQKLGSIIMAILPIGDKFTMNLEEAIEAAQIISPKTVISMHLRESNPEEFKEKLESISTIEVIILKEGESYIIS